MTENDTSKEQRIRWLKKQSWIDNSNSESEFEWSAIWENKIVYPKSIK